MHACTSRSFTFRCSTENKSKLRRTDQAPKSTQGQYSSFTSSKWAQLQRCPPLSMDEVKHAFLVFRWLHLSKGVPEWYVMRSIAMWGFEFLTIKRCMAINDKQDVSAHRLSSVNTKNNLKRIYKYIQTSCLSLIFMLHSAIKNSSHHIAGSPTTWLQEALVASLVSCIPNSSVRSWQNHIAKWPTDPHC